MFNTYISDAYLMNKVNNLKLAFFYSLIQAPMFVYNLMKFNKSYRILKSESAYD